MFPELSEGYTEGMKVYEGGEAKETMLKESEGFAGGAAQLMNSTPFVADNEEISAQIN